MISVIIPLYNKRTVIARTIESVLSQTYWDWELIIVDDGSTDGSDDVVQQYLGDKRIRYIRKFNGGVSSARNRGIMEAKGEWVCYIDADDYFLPEALQTMYNLTMKYQLDIVSANFYSETGNNRVLHSWCTKESIISNPLCAEVFRASAVRAGSMMIKTELMQHHLFDEKLSRFEDGKNNFALFRTHKIAYSPIPVMIYSLDNLGLSKSASDISKDFIFSMDFKDKPFWEKVWLGQLLNWGLSSYPQHVNLLKKQYGLYLKWTYVAKLAFFMGRIINKIMRKI